MSQNDEQAVKALLIHHYQQQLLAGEHYSQITQARQQAAELTGIAIYPGHPLTKVVDEAMESAVVRAAPYLIGQSQTTHEAYDRLVDLLDRQPTLGVRSTTSMIQQAYSTPVPLAYLASNLAKIDGTTTVYEPTVGNGALVLNANPANVIANELNGDRFQEVSNRGFRQLTQHDATQYRPSIIVDVVIANPPFGTLADQPGKRKWFELDGNERGTNQIDHAIANKALSVMRDDGRAVLIMGGVKGKSEDVRSRQYNEIKLAAPYYALYQNYNVIDHFSLWGDLYRKQGAGFPLDVIVIDGRGKSERSLPAVDVPRIYYAFEDLKREVLPNASVAHPRRVSPISLHLDPHPSERGGAISDTPSQRDGYNANPVSQPADPASRMPDSGRSEGGEQNGDPPKPEQFYQPDLAVTGTTSDRGRMGDGNEVGRNTRMEHPSIDDPSGKTGGLRGLPDGSATITGRDDGGTDPSARRDDFGSVVSSVEPGGITVAESSSSNAQDLLVPTPIASRGVSLSTLTPKNLATPTQLALDKLKHEVGDVDEFVRQRLHYPTVEDMWQGGDRLCAEQIDAIALAMVQRDRGKMFLNSDQTGNGKGRWCAAMAMDAIHQGDTAVWVVQQNDMYTAGLKDLADLGFKDLKVFVTDSSAKIPTGNGDFIKTGSVKDQAAEMQRILDGEVHYDLIMTTYAQMQSVQGRSTERRGFLDKMAPRCSFIFDEAHNASGSTIGANSDLARSVFIRGLVDRAKGTVFASATPTKDPAVVDLYARRSDVTEASNSYTLVQALRNGGTPMQQAIASNFAQSGQMIRRERSFDGVTLRSETLPVDRDATDVFCACMGAISRFDLHKATAVESLNEDLKKEAKRLSEDNAIGGAGASSTNFTSLMHNIVDQFGLSIKADQVADLAIDSFRQGQKPVVGFVSTMESHLDRYIDENGIKPGDALDITYADLLLHNLERSRDVITRDHTE